MSGRGADRVRVFGLYPYVQDGRLIALGVTGRNRAPNAPTIPTFGEACRATRRWDGSACSRRRARRPMWWTKVNTALNKAVADPQTQVQGAAPGAGSGDRHAGPIRQDLGGRLRQVGRHDTAIWAWTRRSETASRQGGATTGSTEEKRSMTAKEHPVPKYEPFGWHHWPDDFWMSATSSGAAWAKRRKAAGP